MKKFYKSVVLLASCVLVSVSISGCSVMDITQGIISEVLPENSTEKQNGQKQDDIVIIEKEPTYEQQETVPEETTHEKEEQPATPVTKDTVQYKTYTNGRFGYTVHYPDYFIPQTPPDNGSGLNFVSPDGEFVMNTWGSHGPVVLNVDVTLDSYYRDTLASLDYVPTYKVKKSNFFVISGYLNGNTIYERHILKSDGTENVVKMIYPASREKEFDEIVTHISLNFTSGAGDDSVVSK